MSSNKDRIDRRKENDVGIKTNVTQCSSKQNHSSEAFCSLENKVSKTTKDKFKTQEQESQKHHKEDKSMNGNMANNLEEVKRLGKEMEAMRTNEELEKEGMVADPAQETSHSVNERS